VRSDPRQDATAVAAAAAAAEPIPNLVIDRFIVARLL